MHIYIYIHTYAYAYTCTIIHMRWHRPNTLKSSYWDSQSMHKYTYTYIYTCIYMHTYKYTYTHAYIYIYTCQYTYIHAHVYTHVQHVHMHACKHVWNDSTVTTAWETQLDVKKFQSCACPLQSRKGSPSVASSPIARQQRTTDKCRTTTTNSISSQHHDNAPPRLQPLVCTSAEPIHPVHGPPKLRVDPPKRGNNFADFSRPQLQGSQIMFSDMNYDSILFSKDLSRTWCLETWSPTLESHCSLSNWTSCRAMRCVKAFYQKQKYVFGFFEEHIPGTTNTMHILFENCATYNK